MCTLFTSMFLVASSRLAFSIAFWIFPEMTEEVFSLALALAAVGGGLLAEVGWESV